MFPLPPLPPPPLPTLLLCLINSSNDMSSAIVIAKSGCSLQAGDNAGKEESYGNSSKQPQFPIRRKASSSSNLLLVRSPKRPTIGFRATPLDSAHHSIPLPTKSTANSTVGTDLTAHLRQTTGFSTQGRWCWRMGRSRGLGHRGTCWEGRSDKSCVLVPILLRRLLLLLAALLRRLFIYLSFLCSSSLTPSLTHHPPHHS